MQDFKRIKAASEIVGVVCAILIMIAYGITTYFPQFDDVSTLPIVILLIAVIGLSAGLTFVAVWALESHREKGASGNSLIIQRSSKAVKRMMRLAAKIDRKILLEMTKSEKNEEKIRQSDIFKSLKFLSNKPMTLKEKEIGFFQRTTPFKLAQAVQRQPIQRLAEMNSIIIGTILKLERPLLSAEQYKARIACGKYLLNHSCDPNELEKAYLDYLGWTYSLSGRYQKFKINLEKGIAMLNDHLENSSDTSDFSKTQQLLVRAYRHLGSDQTTLERNPSQCISQLKIALKEWEKLNVPENNEMHVGIQYGIASAEIAIFKRHLKLSQMTPETLKDLTQSYEIISYFKPIAHTFPNQHRYLKFLTLENEVLSLLVKIFGKANGPMNEMIALSFEGSFPKGANELYSEAKKRLSENLAFIGEVLKNNIYADEAIAAYLEQEVDTLFLRVENCVKGVNES